MPIMFCTATSGNGRRLEQQVAAWPLAWWALWALPLALAGVLVLRRLGGALQVGPPLVGVFFLGGLGVAGTAAAVVLLSARSCLASARPMKVGRLIACLVAVGPIAAMACASWAIWLPHSGMWAPGLLCVCVVVQVALLSWGAPGMDSYRHARAPSGATDAPLGRARHQAQNEAESVSPPQLPQVDQHLLRGRDAAGRECVAGTLRLVFPRGSQQATAHVAFCPPLTAMPQVRCRQLAGPEVRIKVTQAVPFGARLEARLPQPAAESVSVHVQLTAAAESHAAAPGTEAPAQNSAAVAEVAAQVPTAPARVSAVRVCQGEISPRPSGHCDAM